MKKKLILNSATSLLLQLITVICGLVLPRLILAQYGSAINGLVQSVTQFLGVVSLLDMGVGQVIQSSLYRPLVAGNQREISSILASGEKFFRRIALILVVYVLILVGVYPTVIERSFEWGFTASLILAISVNSFAQYYFGVVDRILLNADQRAYVQHISQIAALIINTVCCVVLIYLGASIQLVKLLSSLVFMARPIVVREYIKRQYPINWKIQIEGEPIQQKWHGAAQHFTAFILDGTDNIVLTVLSTLENVSIYSVYHMVIFSIRQLYQSAISSLHAIIGELWAKQDMEKLHDVYEKVEKTLHLIVVFLFSCTGMLIIPFVQVYTKGITDANYVQPVFAGLIVTAHACSCLKSVYNMPILGAGHYRQTYSCHIVSTVLNVVISIVGTWLAGLIGVAVGTLIAMAYQMIWMAYYNSKNLMHWPFRNFVKQILVDAITVTVICVIASNLQLTAMTYFAWFILAVETALIAAVVITLTTAIFYRKSFGAFCQWLCKKTEK